VVWDLHIWQGGVLSCCERDYISESNVFFFFDAKNTTARRRIGVFDAFKIKNYVGKYY